MKKTKLIFITTLIFICLLSANTFASTQPNGDKVTYEYIKYIYEHFSNNVDNIETYNTKNSKEILDLITDSDYLVATKKLQEGIDKIEVSGEQWGDLNIIAIYGNYSYFSNGAIVIDFYIVNNGTSNNLGHLKIIPGTTNTNIKVGSEDNEPIYRLRIQYKKNGNSVTATYSNMDKRTEMQTYGGIKSATLGYAGELSSDSWSLLTLSTIAVPTKITYCYYSVPFQANTTTTNWSGFIRGITSSGDTGYYDTNDNTSDSGKNSGDTSGGNTGTTNVDLSKVENGIKDINNNIENIKDKIPTSGDIKKATTSGVINGNNEYWGTSGDLNGEKEQEEIKNIINDAMENVSGELSKNQVFKALESAEKGFFDLFKNKLEEQAYDLKFNWKKTEYQGATLLEDGEINISKMCREIPELGRLQFYIRLIFNFTVIINIIKQIYNLILATLGIDNPFLYEEGEQTTSIDTDTGEYKQYYRNKKRKLW